MKSYPFGVFFVMAGLVVSSGYAVPPKVESIGENTYAITCEATNGFSKNTTKLKDEALRAAEKFCAEKGKQLKVLTVEEHKPKFYALGFASAKVLFKPLAADDPELTAAPTPLAKSSASYAMNPTDDLYTELVKLDELRKRGILTEEEFQAEKKKVLNRSH